jgi:hypothetical protein
MEDNAQLLLCDHSLETDARNTYVFEIIDVGMFLGDKSNFVDKQANRTSWRPHLDPG